MGLFTPIKLDSSWIIGINPIVSMSSRSRRYLVNRAGLWITHSGPISLLTGFLEAAVAFVKMTIASSVFTKALAKSAVVAWGLWLVLCGGLLGDGSAWGAQLSGADPVPIEIDPTRQVASPESIRPWLDDVPLRTRRSGILPEESDLYYRTIAFTRDVNPLNLRNAAREFLQKRWENSAHKRLPLRDFPVYVDLYQHPEEYWGRPITMTGHIQRSVVYSAGENDYALDEICELWLYTDHSQTNPTVVITTQIPDGFPIGETTVDRVTVTGYFYRMYTYPARDAGRFAPLLIAQKIEWIPEDQVGANDRSWIYMIFSLTAMVLVAIALMNFWMLRIQQSRQSAKSQLPGQLEIPPEVETPNSRAPGKSGKQT